MDLAAGRSPELSVRNQERQRFQDYVRRIEPHLIVTDSQAMDLVYPWLSYPEFANVQLTTFSIVMIRMGGADLKTFMDGLRAFKTLQNGNRVLISEACNHNRITQVCEDIGTVQIPKHLKKRVGDIQIDHAFGREFPADELQDYSLGKFCKRKACCVCVSVCVCLRKSRAD